MEALRRVLQASLLVNARERLQLLLPSLSSHWVKPQNMMSSKSKAETMSVLIKPCVRCTVLFICYLKRDLCEIVAWRSLLTIDNHLLSTLCNRNLHETIIPSSSGMRALNSFRVFHYLGNTDPWISSSPTRPHNKPRLLPEVASGKPGHTAAATKPRVHQDDPKDKDL